MRKSIHEIYYEWVETGFTKNDYKLLKEAEYSVDKFNWLSGFKAGVKWAKQQAGKK